MYSILPLLLYPFTFTVGAPRAGTPREVPCTCRQTDIPPQPVNGRH